MLIALAGHATCEKCGASQLVVLPKCDECGQLIAPEADQVQLRGEHFCMQCFLERNLRRFTARAWETGNCFRCHGPLTDGGPVFYFDYDGHWYHAFCIEEGRDELEGAKKRIAAFMEDGHA